MTFSSWDTQMSLGCTANFGQHMATFHAQPESSLASSKNILIWYFDIASIINHLVSVKPDDTGMGYLYTIMGAWLSDVPKFGIRRINLNLGLTTIPVQTVCTVTVYGSCIHSDEDFQCMGRKTARFSTGAVFAVHQTAVIRVYGLLLFPHWIREVWVLSRSLKILFKILIHISVLFSLFL